MYHHKYKLIRILKPVKIEEISLEQPHIKDQINSKHNHYQDLIQRYRIN